METIDKLQFIKDRCKASVLLEINDHKTGYESVSEYMSSGYGDEKRSEGLDEDILEKMIKLDTIIYLHFYPNTPIGFFKLYHYDINKILDKAIEILKEDRATKKTST